MRHSCKFSFPSHPHLIGVDGFCQAKFRLCNQPCKRPFLNEGDQLKVWPCYVRTTCDMLASFGLCVAFQTASVCQDQGEGLFNAEDLSPKLGCCTLPRLPPRLCRIPRQTVCSDWSQKIVCTYGLWDHCCLQIGPRC